MDLASRRITNYEVRNSTETNMNLADLTFSGLVFSQPDAIRLTRPTAATLDNWLRYEHVLTNRDQSGRRVFSFADLLAIDCIEMLTTMFKMPPALSAEFARRAVEQYRRAFEQDQREIGNGQPWSAATRDFDAHFSFARDGESVVEVDGERDDSVMLVLPTRIIARRLLAAIVG